MTDEVKEISTVTLTVPTETRIIRTELRAELANMGDDQLAKLISHLTAIKDARKAAAEKAAAAKAEKLKKAEAINAVLAEQGLTYAQYKKLMEG